MRDLGGNTLGWGSMSPIGCESSLSYRHCRREAKHRSSDVRSRDLWRSSGERGVSA